jgi:hypothetical protein
LGDGPPGFRRNFTCSAVLRILKECALFRYGAITLFGEFPNLTSTIKHFGNSIYQSYNPRMQALWFGLFPFRSPLLRESIFLSLPAANEMFQFTASTSISYVFTTMVTLIACWVPPFGNLWIIAYLQLPKAYRC